MSEATTLTPPGWYPDPSGEPQWRVWTGTQWSEMTRPYGTNLATPLPVLNLDAISALGRVLKFGILGLMAGLTVLVGTLAHGRGSAHPAPQGFVISATTAAIALLAIGTISYAAAARAIVGYWTFWAIVPGVNVFYLTSLTTKVLGGRSGPRLLSTAIFVGIFIAQFRVEAWLVLGPLFMTLDQYRWTLAAREHFSGPTR